MEFQTDDPVADVDEGRARIPFDYLVLLFELGKQDDPGIRLQFHIILLVEIVEVSAVLFLYIEGFEAFLQHLLDLFGNLLLEILHHLDGFPYR
jgi:hypothetical protein